MSYNLRYINMDDADDVVEYHTLVWRHRRTNARSAAPGPERAANGAIPMDPVIADAEVLA